MEGFSLDSSVVVKWFSREEYTDKALKIRNTFIKGGIELIVTPLLYCEVINALRYKPDYNTEMLKRAVNALINLHMKVEEISREILERSVEIAFDAGVTIYDAIPVAVAEKYRVICITADEKTQYMKMRDKYPIKLLKNLDQYFPQIF